MECVKDRMENKMEDRMKSMEDQMESKMKKFEKLMIVTYLYASQMLSPKP